MKPVNCDSRTATCGLPQSDADGPKSLGFCTASSFKTAASRMGGVCVLFIMCQDYASSGLGVASATGATAVSTSSLWGISAGPLAKSNSSTLFGSGSSYDAPQAVGSVGRAGRPSSRRLRITNAFVISAIGWRASVCLHTIYKHGFTLSSPPEGESQAQNGKLLRTSRLGSSSTRVGDPRRFRNLLTRLAASRAVSRHLTRVLVFPAPAATSTRARRSRLLATPPPTRDSLLH